MTWPLRLFVIYVEAGLWLLLAWYENRYPVQSIVCSDNIMCECNRRNCPGATISVVTYRKKVLAN